MTQRAWLYRPHVSEPVVVDHSVRAAWNLEAAIADAEPGNLFPSRVGWMAARNNEFFARTLDGQSAAGNRPFPAETVAVPKMDRTTRPASDMSIEDQVLYGAIVNGLREKIPDGFVSFSDEVGGAYDDFERYPLNQDNVRYVVEGDAAAFYQYVNYERLAYELIGLTGWSDAVEPLVRLLENWMSAPQGIPQGPAASRKLADIYISPASRSLAREGWSFSRYSDDFRIVTRSWTEARQAQVSLERALGELGLVLAAGKSRTLRIETYRQRIARVDTARLNSPESREAFDQLDAGDYEPGIGDRRAVTEADVERANRVLDQQIDILPIDTIGTRLIRQALPVLGSGASPHALRHLRHLLGRYGHLTQSASTYIRLLMGTDAEARAVAASIAWLRGTDFKLPWQVGWVLHALAYAESTYDAVEEFAGLALLDPTLPWFVRGRAALVVGRHGGLPSLTSFVGIYELSPAATRPDLVAAVSIANPVWAERFLDGAADSPILASVRALPADDYSAWI